MVFDCVLDGIVLGADLFACVLKKEAGVVVGA